MKQGEVQSYWRSVTRKTGYWTKAGMIKLALRLGLTTLACLACLTSFADSPSGNVTNTALVLAFDWPTNAFTIANQQIASGAITNKGAMAAMTNYWYFVYGTTTLAGTNTPWQLLQVIQNPPAVTNQDGSVWLEVTVPMVLWQQNFYSIRMSNFLGSSFFGGLAATPPLPPTSLGNNLQIIQAH